MNHFTFLSLILVKRHRNCGLQRHMSAEGITTCREDKEDQKRNKGEENNALRVIWYKTTVFKFEMNVLNDAE